MGKSQGKARMTSATPAARQRALKARRTAAGLVRVQVWIHPDDAPSLSLLSKLRERMRKALEMVKP
jgi:hypothetical protein